ncbi:heavy metal transporter [Sulfolobus sp. A20]|uniref:heavy-metal-associated domain-containing protein n=1 Tax=Sulfolobaceae TaxID=118883 RepID=UPI000845FA33|nr:MULTISPECIES: heavy metal-associated domain-containing protein [unclassified Sulfolobus]TRM75251.1 heavy-metal-associated domain-containing protein [Sulfolobus sp. A20-N-F8]TRM79466.1 heavy-metal-associated domain-containing protein [Sulfolobus sp. B5]TRM82364.1 heavy-metal-associated domain-containing protein [Sulfolobus sp. D5]TRM83316.1 heavy-metal-associated domain-containing protein [Sulfolobus sp. A20-N-F6]TRM84495.1 heavy-metal-associated domain-containing protein [Sulfolobus sp. F3]
MSGIDKILANLGKEMSFQVLGVTCDNCVNKVRRALKTVKGIEEISIKPDYSHFIAHVTIRYKGEVDKKEIEEAIQEASDETPYHEYKVKWE